MAITLVDLAGRSTLDPSVVPIREEFPAGQLQIDPATVGAPCADLFAAIRREFQRKKVATRAGLHDP
jgi:hypothetical protein